VKFFGAKKSDGNGSGDDSKDKRSDGDGVSSDPRKAKRFFEHARTTADAHNYDYSIECFVSGLRWDPESMDHHDQLYEVALKRHASGAKKAGFKEQIGRRGGKTSLEKMLNKEYLWAKDPYDVSLAVGVMENAADAKFDEVVYWVGIRALNAAKADNKPNGKLILKISDLFAAVGRWDKAAEACRVVVQMDPTDGGIIRRLKELEAEQSIVDGNYGDGFRETIRNKADQAETQEDISMGASSTSVIERTKVAFEDSPDDVDLFFKYVRALVGMEVEDYENEAIRVLMTGYEKFKQYRMKMQVGDIKMRQFNRRERDLRRQVREAEDSDDKLKLEGQRQEVEQQQLEFELAEFLERVSKYPSDMAIKFQLGRRQIQMELYDDAIGSFQEAQADPKHRSFALRYLGEAFGKKGWFDEAIDTFRRGIEAHDHDDDRLALELRYELMMVLEQKAIENKDGAIAEEASKVASEIAQHDINYKDIRESVSRLRDLMNSLKIDEG
jgi:tetratricopeptide (TPR) repeat protein